MKRCARCKMLKPIEEFNYKYKSRGIRQYHCRDCERIYIRAHYIRHREYYLKKARARNIRIRNTIRNYVWLYLQHHHCVDCGEADPIVLEFDHVSEKTDDISNMVKYATLNQAINEISHCQVRCANCHRKATAKRQGWTKQVNALVA